MAKRKKTARKPKEVYDFIHLQVVKFSISADASINCEIRDTHRRYSDSKVYSFASDVSLECKLLWPEERPDWSYYIHIYGDEGEYRDFSATLADFHATNDLGERLYMKRGGKSIPVYKPPHGLGFWEKVRGQDRMSGAIWVSPQSLTDMIILLVNVEPVYVHVHELKVDRTRWICGIRLQTEVPE